MKPLTGIVKSNKMQKTIVVEITDRWQHPLYKKVVKRTKKYLAHDENETAKIGDLVSIVSSRPLSKLKKWTLHKVVETAK